MTAASPEVVASKPTRAWSETVAFAVMVVFFVISFPLTRLAAYLERRLI